MADSSPASPGGGGGSQEGGEQSPPSEVGGGGGGGAGREQDRFLPIANVTRIMKKGLPANAKIAKESKEAMQECVSEFISFVTSEASHRCLNEKRKTINGDDLLWAMTQLGFDNYVEPLKLFLQKYRELEGGEGSAKREAGGSHPATSAMGEYQVPQQGSFTQGMTYLNSQFPYGGY